MDRGTIWSIVKLWVVLHLWHSPFWVSKSQDRIIRRQLLLGLFALFRRARSMCILILDFGKRLD